MSAYKFESMLHNQGKDLSIFEYVENQEIYLKQFLNPLKFCAKHCDCAYVVVSKLFLAFIRFSMDSDLKKKEWLKSTHVCVRLE